MSVLTVTTKHIGSDAATSDCEFESISFIGLTVAQHVLCHAPAVRDNLAVTGGRGAIWPGAIGPGAIWPRAIPPKSRPTMPGSLTSFTYNTPRVSWINSKTSGICQVEHADHLSS